MSNLRPKKIFFTKLRKNLLMASVLVFGGLIIFVTVQAAPEFKSGMDITSGYAINFLENGGSLDGVYYTGRAAQADYADYAYQSTISSLADSAATANYAIFAESANFANSAGAANSVPWSGITGVPVLPTLPSGASGQTLYFNGTDWTANSNLFNNGTDVGINTDAPSYKLDVQGGQINASGGLCIAGDCRANWEAVINGTNGTNGTNGVSYWDLSGDNLFASSTAYIVGIGTISPGYKLDVQGGQINASDGLCIAGDCRTSWTDVINGTNGSNGISYWDLSGSNLFASSTTYSVGIGTISPGYKLDVQGGQINASDGLCIAGDCRADWASLTPPSLWATSTNNLYNTNIGNVGIGISNPTAKLQVAGSIISNSTVGGIGLCLGADCITAWDQLAQSALPTGVTGQTLRYNGSAWVANDTIFNNGTNVGISTTTPAQALDVKGNISLTGTIYKNNNSADRFDFANWYSNTSASINTDHGAGIRLNGDLVNGGSAIDMGGSTMGIGNAPLGSIVFSTANTARMGINSRGQIAIGTTNTPADFNLASTEPSATSIISVKSRTAAMGIPYIRLVNSGGTPYLDINANCQSETFIGVGAGANVNTNMCSGALFIGLNAGNKNSNGMNVALGPNAFANNANGGGNTAVGVGSMASSAGSNNTAIGKDTMYNQTGSNNVALGLGALSGNMNSSDNIALGAGALAAGSGGQTVAIGNGAGYSSVADSNVYIGHQAGYLNQAGSGNIFIGYQAGYNNSSGFNQLFIDNSNTATPLIYGDFDTNRIGINTNSPSQTLSVGGNMSANAYYIGGSAGLSRTIIVKGSAGANCNIVVSGGIITSTNCP